MHNEPLHILASKQFGLFTTAQAAKIGVSRLEVHRLHRKREIREIRRGVYSTSPITIDAYEELRGAWISLDPTKTVAERLQEPKTAVICTTSAAEIYRIGDLPTYAHEFFVPQRKQTKAEDIHIRIRQLPAEDTQIFQGMKVTTPTRTILDLLAEGEELEHIGNLLTDAVRMQLEIDWKRIQTATSTYKKIYGLSGERIFAELAQTPQTLQEQAAFAQSMLSSISPESIKNINKQLSTILSRKVDPDIFQR